MGHPSSVPMVQSTMLEIWTLSVVDGWVDSTRKPPHLGVRLVRWEEDAGRARRETPLPPWGKAEKLRAGPPMLNSTQLPLSV